MKYLSSLVIFSCLFLSSTFSQVKKQYVDADNSSTTVVVKEDNASDIDILNANFDINAFGLGEVIMIKTEKEPKEVQPKVTEPKVTTPKVTPEKLVVKEVTKPARNVAAMPVERSKSVGGSSAKSSSRSTSTKAKKYKKKKKAKRYRSKKFKKKKKRRRVLCPSF